MSHFVYLTGLLIGISGLLLIDRRWKLAFWNDRRRTWTLIGRLLFLFFIWDVSGIFYGIFAHGNSPYSLPFVLAPEFPLEEIVFLFLLVYTTLITYRGVSRRKA